MSIYDVSHKRWPTFRDLWPRNGWDPLPHWTTLWKFRIFRHCQASHTKATANQILPHVRGLQGLPIQRKNFMKIRTQKISPQPKLKFSANMLLVTSALNTTYLRNDMSHRQTKQQVSVYNLSPKADLLSVTIDPETAKIRWLIVTNPMKI